MTDIADWYKNIPKFTKYWLSLTVGISILGKIGILPTYSLLLWPEKIYSSFQIWRPITALFFYPTSFHFILNCVFLYNYSLRLETETFKLQPGDYFFLLFFNWLGCVIVGWIIGFSVLMDPMVLSVIYIWSQLNKETIVNFWFGTRFKAMYLPWILLLLNFILSDGAIYSIVGIFIGHLYFFLKFKYPQELGGNSYLETPAFFKSYFPDVRGGVHGFGVPPVNQRNVQENNDSGIRNRIFGSGQGWGRGHVLGNQ